MGDEHDAFDLPTQQQSGSVDMGHISESVQAEESRIRGEQGEQLNNLLNQYYSGDIDGNAMYVGLGDLGYSEHRVDDLYEATRAERIYREGHSNNPSDLSVNQLEFLGTSSGFNIGGTTIHTDEDGRKYVDDFRTRQDPGDPARLYLPTPTTFDPLTRQQISEISRQQTYLSFITLQEPDTDNALSQDSIDLNTRRSVSQLLTQYYAQMSQPGNDQRRRQLYVDIQNLPGLQNQNNIRPKLLQLFNDIAREQQYRVDNNGRPQGLTNEQWANLQNSPYYYGQPILQTDTVPRINYIVSGSRFFEINEQGLNTGQDGAQRSLSIDDIPGNTQTQLNLLATEFLTNRQEDPNTLSQNILSAVNYDPDDPESLQLRLETEDLVNSYNMERLFRNQNNGRPSVLTTLQYEFMMNHALQDGEPRYTGEPLVQQTLADGSIGYGFNSWDSNIPNIILIPKDDIINQMIQGGIYTRPQPTIPEGGLPPLPPRPGGEDLPPPQPTITPAGGPLLPVRPISEFQPRPDIDPSLAPPVPAPILPDEQLGPSITGAGEPHLRPLPASGLAPPGFDPPIVPGTTQPIDLRTGEDLPVDSLERNVLRYQQYFNDNQSLYYGFREMFRDIIPVLTAGAGGYITYLYEASKQKGTIQTIINQETELLNNLQGRIDSTNENLQTELSVLEQRTITGEEVISDIQRIQQRTDIVGGEAMKSAILRNRIRSLEQATRLIEQQRNTIENLQNQIKDNDVYTQSIKNNIETLQNRNYEILYDLQSSAPKILMGVNVGYTLGLMLSGYLYPTYMNINEPYSTADNIEYTKNNINQKHIEKKRALEQQHLKQKDVEIPVTIKREYDEVPSRIVKPFEQSFKPVKHGKRPLKYKEIQELKATLNKSELNNLKNKFLYFDDDKLILEKSNDKCKNVVGETQIPKRKVF